MMLLDAQLLPLMGLVTGSSVATMIGTVSVSTRNHRFRKNRVALHLAVTHG